MNLGGQSKDVVRLHSFHGFLIPWDREHLKHGVHDMQETDNKKGKAVSLTQWSEGFLGWEAEGWVVSLSAACL